MLHNRVRVIKNIQGPNRFIGNGTSCRTIWYASAKAANKSLKMIGKIITGADLCNCKFCANSYSMFDQNYKKFPINLCKGAKEDYAKFFERLVK